MSVERLTWPVLSKRPKTWSWRLVANTQVWESPLNKSTQTAEFPGVRWLFRFGYERLREDDWRVLDAFLAQLCGMSGRVLLTPMHASVPRGVATGIPVVAGGGQLGRSLNTSGWTPGTSSILRAGDYFSVATLSGPELKILTADAASDADGKATLHFNPPLRNSPVNGASIITTDPVCPMRLVDGDQGEMSSSAPRFAATTLEFVESWL